MYGRDEPPTPHPSTNLTPLSVAIEHGHEELALQLLAIPQLRGMEAKKQFVRSVPIDNYTFLHLAAHWNALRVVEALVELGMDINVKDASTYTALDHAIGRGSLAVTRFLLGIYRERGELEQALKREWLDTHGKRGPPPLLYLATTAILKNPNTTAELERFDERQLVMFRLLVEEFSADVTLPSAISPPPLHTAAHIGKLLLVKYMIETCGVPVDALSSDSRRASPLHFACMCGGGAEKEAKVIPVVEYLVSKGASLTRKAGHGKNAREMAYEHGNLRIYHYLIAQHMYGRAIQREGGGDKGSSKIFTHTHTTTQAKVNRADE